MQYFGGFPNISAKGIIKYVELRKQLLEHLIIPLIWDSQTNTFFEIETNFVWKALQAIRRE